MADQLRNVTYFAEMLGVSEPTIWRRVADGTLPPPIKIVQLSRWADSDIEAAIKRLITARDAKAA